MGKYQKTIYNHKQNCLRRIKDLISKAIIYGFTHQQILEERKKDLFDFNSWKRLPLADKEYLRGYFEASISHLYRFDIVWLHYHLDNEGNRVFFHCFEAIPRGKPFYSGHFWVKSKKPFSLSNETVTLPVL